jgi:hypothetical protein
MAKEDNMAEEIIVPTKKVEKVLKTIVVEQLPTQAVNKALDEKGNEFNLVTRDDALTEILEICRGLKKGLL